MCHILCLIFHERYHTTGIQQEYVSFALLSLLDDWSCISKVSHLHGPIFQLQWVGCSPPDCFKNDHQRASSADVNASDEQERTCLHLAAMRGHLEVCRALFECARFVEVSAKDGHGHSALHYAAAKGHADICQCILQNRNFVEVDASSIFGHTALHLAAQCPDEDY